MRKPLFVATIALACSACHGAAGSALPPAGLAGDARAAQPAQVARAAATVKVTLAIPQGYNPKGLRGMVYAQWLSSSTVASFSADISTSSPLCTPAGKGRTCTLSTTLPTGGPYLLAAYTYNKPPSGGSFTGARLLGAGMVPLTVSGSTTVKLTASRYLARASVALQSGSLAFLKPAVIGIIVTGYDSKGNAIVANVFYGPQRSRAAIGVSVDAASSSAFFIPRTTIRAPFDGRFGFRYVPAGVPSSGVANGFAATFSATPSNAGSTAGTATLTVPPPHFIETALPGSNPFPYSIVAGPDGAMWFGTFNAGQLGRITTAMKLTNLYPGFNHPQSIVAGPDGALWVAQFSGDAISRVATSGSIHNYALPVNTYATGISVGPKVSAGPALWFASQYNNYVQWITTAGTLGPHYALPSASVPTNSVKGADGNLYFVLNGNSHGRIAQMTSSGTIAHTFTLPGASPSPQNIVTGPNQKLYISDTGQSAIFAMTTTGAFTKFAIPAQYMPAGPIAFGPDGNLWFSSGLSYVGRLDISNGSLGYVALPVAYSYPNGIALGPDGALYLTEDGAQGQTARIARML